MLDPELMILPKIRYQLHPDCCFITYDQLTYQQREETRADESDIILTRNGARSRSKILVGMAASFYRQFEVPTIFVEAVARYSKKHGISPELILDETLPTMESLLFSGFLFPEGSTLLGLTRPTLKVGDWVDDFKILRVVQSMSDVEVYKVTSECNQAAFALKILRTPQDIAVRNDLEDEHFVLSKLDGSKNSAVGTAGVWNDRYYITSAWVDGETLDHVLRRMNIDLLEDRLRILNILHDVIRSLITLHDQNCLHGDIHFKNIIVQPNSVNVCFIDFGSASLKGYNDLTKNRYNVPFFTEPEQAAVLSAGQSPPVVTPAAEQFMLGAVFYYLLVHVHYADFSHLRTEMLEQIQIAPPRPFSHVGKKPWPELEGILHKSLAKNPADRFPSLCDFGDALAELINTEIHTGAAANGFHHPPSTLQASSDIELLRDPDSVETLLQPPLAPIATGLAGVAYGLYRLAWLKDDGELLAQADHAIRQAILSLEQPNGLGGFEKFGAERMPEQSLYLGRSGVHLVSAIIAHARGDQSAYAESAEKYVTVVDTIDDWRFLDLNVGAAGLLLGCCLAEEHTFRADQRMLRAGDQLAGRILDNFGCTQSTPDTASPIEFGIAHGKAGVLLALLRWSAVRSRPVAPAVIQSVEALADQYFSEQFDQYSVNARNGALNPYGPTWCNGASGMIHFWLEASICLGSDSYSDLAEATADYSWEHRYLSATDLCCGATGWGYAFLRMFRATGKNIWLEKANECLRIAMSAPVSLQHPLGLYKGKLGTWLLAEDCRNPVGSYMPLFEKP